MHITKQEIKETVKSINKKLKATDTELKLHTFIDKNTVSHRTNGEEGYTTMSQFKTPEDQLLYLKGINDAMELLGYEELEG
jgi:hypothetical protein